MTHPLKTEEWRRLSAQVRREEPICWLRFQGCTVLSTTADHVIPYRDRPDLALVRSNLRGACFSCNHRRGSTPVDALNLQAHRPAALDVFG